MAATAPGARDRPLARAVRTKSSRITSSTAERVQRASTAACTTRQRDGRQQQRLEAFPQAAAVVFAPAGEAAGADPLQLHREQQDQQDREPEARDRDAQLAGRHHADVAEPVVARRGIDAQRQRHHHRQRHRHRRQRQRDAQPLGDQLAGGRVVGDAHRRAALQQAADPVARSAGGAAGPGPAWPAARPATPAWRSRPG